MDTIVNFFDICVNAGTLTGVGSNPTQKLNVFRTMLVNGNYEAAVQKCDGKPSPPDFVEGVSRAALHSKIYNELFPVYPAFKQSKQMV